MKSIVLYLHVHQPYRLRHYTIFDIASEHNYFEAPAGARENNRDILQKVVEKSYAPTNRVLLKLLREHPEFRLSLSITGVLLEQLEAWAPEVLQSFRELVATGRVEILGETYHHSLAFFYSRSEFEAQVAQHKARIEALFGQTPQVFRNTELAYNNDVAAWAERAGYRAIIAEGWDAVLGWRSPNFVYRPSGTDQIRLLLKNYKLSDDIAFRFGDRSWSEWPLTAAKFAHWLNSVQDAQLINLFMDYETFGEHQWGDGGIFDFLENLPAQWLAQPGNNFMTISEAVDAYQPADSIDAPYTITWADTDRDLSAWTGNPMQTSAITSLYELAPHVLASGDAQLIETWRRLQTSDHFYYMCTKWWNDGDIHAYFSPYESPYEGFLNFMNAWHDLKYRLAEKGLGA